MYTRMNIDFSFQLSPLNEELRSVNDSVYSRLVAPSTVLWLSKITYYIVSTSVSERVLANIIAVLSQLIMECQSLCWEQLVPQCSSER